MQSLPVIHPPAAQRSLWSYIYPVFLRLYRLGIIVVIVLIIHRHYTRLKIDGDKPIAVEETKVFLPTAARLVTDESPRMGLFIEDGSGQRIGYAVRTSPISDHIKGYQGPTDTLVVLDAAGKVKGIRIRSSWDTKVHVHDVSVDEYFMALWTDKTWDEVAGMEPRAAGVEGVSGASLTSLCIANSIYYRFKKVKEEQVKLPPPRITRHDVALMAVIGLAMVFSFTRLRSHTWFRRAFQLILIGYVGLWNGQLIAQSLFAGWSKTGFAWRMAPALALLAAAALIIPWTTRRALYCSQICPHGAAQELLGRLTRKKLRIHGGLEAGLRCLPAALIALVIIVVMYQLPLDLASIEPFDAYLAVKRIGAAGWAAILMGATMIVAIVGLVASIFVPMAYCKFGCPTGMLLNFVRSHGKADHFGRRDVVAGLLVLMTVGVYYTTGAVHQWIWR